MLSCSSRRRPLFSYQEYHIILLLLAPRRLGIAEMLTGADCLQSLTLAWNCLSLRGAAAVADSLGENACLKTLDLAWNGFADEGAERVGPSSPSGQQLRREGLHGIARLCF